MKKNMILVAIFMLASSFVYGECWDRRYPAGKGVYSCGESVYIIVDAYQSSSYTTRIKYIHYSSTGGYWAAPSLMSAVYSCPAGCVVTSGAWTGFTDFFENSEDAFVLDVYNLLLNASIQAALNNASALDDHEVTISDLLDYESPEQETPPASPPVENNVQPDTGGDPVFTSNGEYSSSVTDVVIPGKSLSVEITRTYGSQRECNGRFGYGWDMNYNMKIREMSDGNLILLDGKGYRREFTETSTGSGIYKRDADLRKYIEAGLHSGFPYTLVNKGGLYHKFDANGNLVEIADRHENTITFGYAQNASNEDVLLPVEGHSKYFPYEQLGGPANRYDLVVMEYKLKTITDDLGRLYVLHYDDDDDDDVDDGSGLLTSFRQVIGQVDDDINEEEDDRVWEYSYDPLTNDLLTVTGPATADSETSNLVTTYVYDGLHNLKEVYDAKNDPAIVSTPKAYLVNNFSVDKVASQKYGESDEATPVDSLYGFTYDQDNNRAVVGSREQDSDVSKSVTVTAYNDAGQTLSSTVATNDGLSNLVAYTTTNEYNTNGNLTRTIMPARNCAEFSYDANGNLTEIMSRPECDVLPFNGTSDFVTVDDGTDYDFEASTDDFSITLWVKRQNSGAVEYLLDKRDTDDDGWALWLDANDKLVFSFNAIDATSTTAIDDDKWHYIAVSVDQNGDSDISIYIDGRAAEGVTTLTGNLAIDDSLDLNIGRSSYQGSGYIYFTGSLDDVMILSKSLERIDTFGLSIHSQGLIGYWKMDELFGTTDAVTDSSSNSNNGTTGRDISLMLADGKVDDSITSSFTYVTDTATDFDYIDTMTDAMSNVTYYGYDFEGVDEDGNAHTYSTSAGNLMWIKYPTVTIPNGSGGTTTDTPVVKFTYYTTADIKKGRIETVTSTDGIETKYYYYDNIANDGDNYGHLKQIVVDPTGYAITTTYEYDAIGRANKVTNDLSEETGFVYDNLDLLKEITYPIADHKTKYEYNKNKKLETLKRKFGSGSVYQETGYTYNLLDNLKTITDPLGNVITNKFDEDENVEFLEDAELNETEYIYDIRGILAKSINAEEALIQDAGTEYSYDANGNLKMITDALGQETTYDYDSYDRLIKTTYPENSASQKTTEEFAYDNNGNVVFKKTRKDEKFHFEYDAINRLLSKSLIVDDADVPAASKSGTWDSTTDTSTFGDGSISSSSVGGTITFEATVSGESVISMWWSGTGYSSNVTVDIYDGTTLLTTTSLTVDQTANAGQWNQIGTVYTFSGTAKVVITVPSGGTACADAVKFASTEYLYDIAGRIARLTDQAGEDTVYAYDTLGRIETVTDPASTVVGYDHDDLGRRTRLEYPDHDEGTTDSYITYEYDAMGRLEYIYYNGDTDPLAHYEYDTLSRRSYVQYDRNTDGTYDSRTDYDYVDRTAAPAQADIGNWLQQIDNDINGTDHIIFDYAYDKVGNRLSSDDGATVHDYTYDNIYQLTEDDNTTDTIKYNWYHDLLGNWDYIDLNGSLDTEFTINAGNDLNQYETVGADSYTYDKNGNLTDDGTYTYQYDAENRLVSVDSGTTATYAYDAQGRRISRYDGVNTTEYVYDGDQVIAEYDGTTLLRKFIYGPGIDEPICMIVKGTPDQWYFYHFDGLGSVVALSNTSGAIVEKYSYDAFGTPTVKHWGSDETWSTGDDYSGSVSQEDNPYMFTGRRWDDETGLYYYRARMYKPQIGRFLQTDPIGYEDGMNIYSYCVNNPFSWIDPYGMAVGEPGFWESMIPVWGSGRAAINNFQEGKWIRGTINTAVAVSDVFLVKAAASGIAKGAFKLGSHTWGATSKWLTKKGWRQFKGQHMHHWLIKQGGRIGKMVPEIIKNQPWNLMPMKTAALHRALHGRGTMNAIEKLWHGTPRWFKALGVSIFGRAANGCK